MAAMVYRLMDTASLSGGKSLEHAAVNEDGQYLPVQDINGNDVEIDLKTASGNISFQVDGFLRYVRWTATDGGTAPSTPAIVGIDVVAKE